MFAHCDAVRAAQGCPGVELAPAGLAVVAGAFTTSLLWDRAVFEWVRTHPKALPVRVLTLLRESSPLSRVGLSEYLIPVSSALYLASVARDSKAIAARMDHRADESDGSIQSAPRVYLGWTLRF